MKIDRRILVVGVAVAVLAVGAGIAYGVSGDDDEQVTGSGADQAKAAAVQAVGGGTAVSVEQGDEGNVAYEVEVKREDGSLVEVALDGRYGPLGSEADDDSGAEDEGDEEEKEGSDDR
jgi:hypothetical protein